MTNFLTPNQASKYLHCKPYSINRQAQSDPNKLGFPVIIIGRRVLIPRRQFLDFIGGNENGKDSVVGADSI